MPIIIIVISILLIILSLLPFIQNQHWVFRVPEFIKIQILALQIIIFILAFFYLEKNKLFFALQIPQGLLILYHIYILIRYTKFWKTPIVDKGIRSSDKIKIIACNVYQENTHYEKFIQFIQTEKPDIFLTMESNSSWEQALSVLETDYPFTQKATLENTYGMHLYSRLEIKHAKVHYFVADDIPSIEAHITTDDGYDFIFFGVHPAPPSPTEEENSKERDGDLLSVAKAVKESKLPVVVTGDFNNVAWAKSSILFRKTSELIDARIGRGVISTFHAKYWFFRVPLDLLFHSSEVFIDQLFTYPDVGSDHFPIGCTFHIDRYNDVQEERIDQLEHDEMQEVNELIEEGSDEVSDNRK